MSDDRKTDKKTESKLAQPALTFKNDSGQEFKVHCWLKARCSPYASRWSPTRVACKVAIVQNPDGDFAALGEGTYKEHTGRLWNSAQFGPQLTDVLAIKRKLTAAGCVTLKRDNGSELTPDEAFPEQSALAEIIKAGGGYSFGGK